jgi:hypothetical protein
MMFPIGYYSIEEAAEYLSKALNQPINYKDVVDIAASGRIRFCKRFNESLSKFSIVNGTLKCEGEYGFRGVIGIPAERILPTLNELITPDRDKITFSTIKQIIEIERLNHPEYDPRLIEHGAWLGKKKINESPWDKPEQKVFIVNLHEVYVPEQDLLDFIAENQAKHRCINNESNASTSKVGAMENAIIAALVADGYDPLRLPRYKNGLPGVKAQIRKKLGIDKGSFDRVWQGLLNKKLISYIPE